MVSEFLVPSVGNILFDDVTHCNLSFRTRGLLLTTAYNTKPGEMMFIAPSDGCDVDHFHGSSAPYIICMLTVMHIK